MSRTRLLMVLLLSVLALGAMSTVLSQEEQPPIIYNSYQSDPDPRRVDAMVVALWEEQHPDIPVVHSTIAHEDFKQALRIYLTAEPPPDVLTWFAGNRANFFIERGLIYNFLEAWNQPGFGDMYAPGFQWLATYYLDGQGAYFLPTSYYWWAIYYRPSLFEAAGITETPATWDDLLGACDALNAIGVAPIAIGTLYKWPAAGWFDYINMRLNGPEFHFGLMALGESYTDERVVATFNTWEQLFEHDCFIDDPAAYDWQSGVQFMASGEAAMYLIGDFVRDEARANFPDLLNDLDFFQFPVINPDVPIGEDAPTDGFFIAANTANPEGAMQFLTFLGSAEVQQIYLDELKRLPTRTDVDLSNLDELTQRGIALVQSADMVAQFYDRDTTPEMAEAGMDAFMEFWDDPDSLPEILESLEADRLRILEEMGTGG